MTPGFLPLLLAQFVSGLADSALLIVTIARLGELAAPAWQVPLLKLGFTLAYVLLAPWVGPLADARPKARVMLLANGVKAAGCLMLITGGDPLLAFAVAGLGAAAYSPAKYGLVTELLPAGQLVRANGWIEVSTVCAVILGTVAGGLLVSPALLQRLPALGTSPLETPMALVLGLYLLAGLLNLRIPDSGCRYPPAPRSPALQVGDFWRSHLTLWRDALGRVTLSVTTLFWGVGATLQFLVLRWAQEHLDLGLDQAAYLQGVTALGVTLGAVLAGRLVPLSRATAVLPLGLLMGLLMPLMTLVDGVPAAALLLGAVGALAGFFVVPMNALLQHRGCTLLSAGRSIAVQNFNENASVLLMLGLYSALVAADLPLQALLWGFGLSIAAVVSRVAWQHHHDRPGHAARRRQPTTSPAHPLEPPCES
ncbi:putative MFS family arabinose efflux permease [Sphaerotilus hippei]|uniref:Putative MFS family arabinose efflux permease n=1 Tax=Sphaerotilus hippei TaxID=744406 RepID=A0A318H978_9BURK|nr:lysophospholipid transporter LplT [Sphaerotilus hippei]PXW94777.1 putative MFS family arabinose efflux permease [Sphaerotilus hippei]